MEAMAGDSHVAGQPSSRKVAEYAMAKFKSFGLDARIEEFEAMMPWPLETHAWMASCPAVVMSIPSCP
jgi:N-acetylated-alpha-linked acidic dipeptidase